MSHKPLTYFTIFSVAAHVALFGPWNVLEQHSPASDSSSIEIGLITLPRIEKDFRTNRDREQKASPEQAEMGKAGIIKPSSIRQPMPEGPAASVAEQNNSNDQFAPPADNPDRANPVESDLAPHSKTELGNNLLVATEAAPLSSMNPAPQYPEEALRYGWEGEVWLKVDVDRSGAVYRVRVDRSSGYPTLDQAALKTVKRWLFEPARIGQEAISATVRVPVRFRIKRS